ncbi:MAG: hypothetical protein CMF25_00610 [Kangiellaceae bacterium]|nr:hypothetical protein [Kangiellaceae bacterium]
MLKKYIDSCSRFAKLEPDFDHTASWNCAFLMDIDWQTYLYDPQHNWIDRLDKMALRRFFDENVAMEAMAFVFERLKKDNYAKLNKFQGKSQPSTFLISVVRNLLEDYADHRFGTCEPPLSFRNTDAPQ